MSQSQKLDIRPFRYMPAPPGYFQSADCIREDIASREEDIASWQATVDSNRQEIPRLQVETLQRQLDIARARLEIHELRAKLAAKEGRSECTHTSAYHKEDKPCMICGSKADGGVA